MKESMFFSVPGYMVGRDGKMILHYLLEQVVDLSRKQSNRFLGTRFNEEHFWILMAWDVDVWRLPAVDEELYIETYIEGYRQFFIHRVYRVSDRDGNEIVFARSIWTLMDPGSRKLIRIPNETFPEIGKPTKKYLPLPKGSNAEPDKTYIGIRTVRRSDIDFNLHVNNTVYLRWIHDLVSYEDVDGFLLNHVQIDYLKEIMPDEEILITLGFFRSESELKLAGCFEDRDKSVVKAMFELRYLGDGSTRTV